MSATARDLLAEKNSSVVYTAAPGDTVAEACRAMEARRVGCLVVVEGSRVEGLLGGREVVERVVAAGRDPEATRVAEVMARGVPTVGPEEPVERIEARMRERHLRLLPVAGDRGTLLGVVTRGDVAAWRAAAARDAAPPSP
ncbi:MAG TPA: CBS domain-containing protein [Anaeromyxobacteraceae bacterium]